MPRDQENNPDLQRFRALADAGYGRDLLPIMPANLPAPERVDIDGTVIPAHPVWEKSPPHMRLSAHSKIKPDPKTQRVAGKIPGKLIDDGWTGYGAWPEHEATDADFVEWASWPCVGIGLNTRELAPFDIDILDAPFADEVAALVTAKLGDAPVRIGRAPKQLLLYRAQEPITKRRLAFTLPDGTAHAVEVLGKGQQFVAEGMHPSGKPYTWPDGDLSRITLDCLPVISSDQIDETIAELECLVRNRVGSTVELSRARDGAPPKPPTGDPLDQDRAVRMATVLDPGRAYPGWRDLVWAIMAIPLADGTPEEQHEWRRQLAHDWSAGKYWPGGCPLTYEGPEAVDAIIASDKHTGIHVGTLIDAAIKAGFDPSGEPPRDPNRQTPPGWEKAPDKEAPKSRFRFLRRSEYADFRLAPPLFPGILPAVGPFHIIGRQSSLKSFIVTEFGFSACTGEPAFGEWAPSLSPGWFIYCAGEGQDGFMAKRVRAWEKARNVDLNKHPFLFLPTVPLALPDGLERDAFAADLGEAIKGSNLPVRMILFDTQAHMSGGADSNHEHEIKLVGLLAKHMSEKFQCAVGVIVHPAKHDKGSDSARGSQVNTEMFSVAWKVERLGKKEELLTKLTLLKERDDQDGTEFVLQGRLVTIEAPGCQKGDAPEFYKSIVMGLASAKEARRFTGGGSTKEKGAVGALLACLRWFSDWKRERVTAKELYLAGQRMNDWLSDPDENGNRPDAVLAAPMTAEEHAGWPAGRKRLGRLARDRKKHFGTVRIASKAATEKEWTWFPHVAPEIDPDADDEGGDE